MAGVVDVFAGARKVYKLGGLLQLCMALKFTLDPVFHRLHVMVGGFLNLFNGQCIVHGKVLHQTMHVAARCGGQRFELLHACIAQRDEPSHFHLHTGTHITVLAHAGAQGFEFVGIAAIQRGNSRNGGEIKGKCLHA